MSANKCCSSEEGEANVNVNVNVDVPKIVKYLCITGILIVGIIFGTRTYKHILEKGCCKNCEIRRFRPY